MKAILLIALIALIAVAYTSQDLFFNQQSIIEEVNQAQKSWVAGHNKYFDGRTMQEIKNLMGTILETPEQMQLPLKDIKPLKNIPEEFSSAEHWPKCESLKEVRDQSTCGSCWAFGAVQAMSDRICILSNQTLQTRISAEDLLTCCGSRCGDGCNGGSPSAAWNYWKRNGIVTGDLYGDKKWCSPYTFPPCDHHTTGKYEPCGSIKPTPKCRQECINGYTPSYSDDKWFADSVYSITSQVAKIQTEIMTHGPVQASFTVYADFLTYKSGVYHHTTGKPLGGHAVKITGWGVQNGTPYWEVANSWNEDWGNKGYFRIKRGNDECYFESNIVAGIPKLKSSVIQIQE